MTVVYLGFGSNMGDKEEVINIAIKRIQKFCEITRLSSLYVTEPVGYKNQERFLNCVVEVKTKLDPLKLLTVCRDVEQQLGRKTSVKNGPRIIDIDILFYGDKIIKRDDLVIPHPRLHERLFVLQPMMDANPGFVHPVLQKTIKELFDQVRITNAEKVEWYKEMVFNGSSYS